MAIEFVRPTEEHIFDIASNMRAADAAEVWASQNHTPIEALMVGLKTSDFSTVILCDGRPAVMYGLVRPSLITGRGVLWMLGSEYSLKFKRHFFIQTPKVIEEMLDICPYLYNYVHAENHVSIEWLEWLGFTIEKPEPTGIDGELFHLFHKERLINV